MTVFLVSLAVFLACGLAMALGPVLAGRPFSGGCGGKPAGSPRCEDCPRRRGRETEGES